MADRTIRLVGLKVITVRNTAVPKANITNIRACFSETSPEGMGLFLPLALSRSASTRSFRIYVPAVTSREAMGSGRVIRTMVSRSGLADDNSPRTPGKQNSPVTVARQ
jgi:hypothetical protein